MAGNKKLEKYENEKYYLLLWSDKRHFAYNCLSLSDKDISVSQTDNFVNVNVFKSVTSPRVLLYRCILHYFLTMPVGFNFNLKEQCHKDFALLGQFCAKIITLRL